jgi:ABC-type multidrug transport system fused ATPase/permease subunit
VACSLALALSFAASLSAVVPVLRLFIAEEGPRLTLQRMAAGRVWNVDLDAYHPRRDDAPGLDLASAWVLRTVHPESPLAAAGAESGDLVLPPADGQPADSFVEDLASPPDPFNLRLYARSRKELQPVTLQPPHHELQNRLLIGAARKAASLLPADRTPQARRRTLAMVFAVILALVLFSSVCRFFAEYLVVIASNRAVMDLRRDMYRTVLYLPMSWFGRHLSETMSRVVTDFKDIERGYRALFGHLTTEPIKIVVLLACAVVLDWRITSFALVAGALGAIIVSLIGRRIRKASRKLLAGYAQMMGVLNATLLGMRVVRAHNNQTFERRRMWQADRRLLTQLLKIGRWEALTGPALEIMGVTVIMAGVLWLADHVFSDQMKPERFMLLVGFLVAVFDSIRRMSTVLPRLARADGAAQRVFEMMDRPIEKPASQAPSLSPLQNTIEFRNVTFTYPESQRPALQDVSWTVRRGQKVALVGPNGSGKTTLISLLCRFFEGPPGSIFFDGRDISRYSVESLRDQFSLVTQDAVAFAVTVFDNIAYGVRGASEEAVIEAARRAYAHEFITALPKGYQTILGEFGATLSGGQRQRLALARAIFRGAPIFIFDEATSQVDVDSEQKIHRATQEFMAGRTSFVIAHRIATITDADQIAVFDDGRLIDVGRHADLLQRCTLYATLYRTHTAP